MIWNEVTPRVADMRQRYRTTRPRLDTARFRIVTEFYQENPQLTGILKRAKSLKNLCENIPVVIHDGELIAGEMVTTYRASAIFPEITFSWLSDELETGDPGKRETDPYIVSEEDKAYILSKKDFWLKNNMSAIFDE